MNTLLSAPKQSDFLDKLTETISKTYCFDDHKVLCLVILIMISTVMYVLSNTLAKISI